MLRGAEIKSQLGFTLIEVLITLTITVGLAGLGLLIGSNFTRSESLDVERYNLVSILRKARNQAMSNLNQADHGVFIATSTYIIFEGVSYASRIPDYDEVFGKGGGIIVSGPSEIAFKALQGNSNVSGTITLSDNTKGRNIFINYEGRVDW